MSVEFSRISRELLNPQGRNIWVAEKDVTVAAGQEGIVLPPKSTTQVPVNAEAVRQAIPSDWRIGAQISTRSRVAQSFLNINEVYSYDAMQRALEGDEAITHIPVDNHSARAIELAHGFGIGRPYAWYGERLTGVDLWSRIRSKDIHISGSPGSDWQPLARKIDKDYTLVGIKMVVDQNPQNQRTLPPGEKIRITDSADYRQEIDSHLQPLSRPITSDTVWIGQTVSTLKIPEDLYGVMDTRIPSQNSNRYSQPEPSRHFNSVLLESKAPAWNIRTEIIGPAESVCVYFASKGR